MLLPPSARITATGPMLQIDWRATPDDAAAIGERSGLFETVTDSGEIYRSPAVILRSLIGQP